MHNWHSLEATQALRNTSRLLIEPNMECTQKEYVIFDVNYYKVLTTDCPF